MESYPQVINQKKRSFFSTVAWGVSATVVTLIIGVAGITLYGMNIADRKSDNLLDLVKFGVDNLPQICESLPPVLADALNDQRRPDYAAELNVSARLAGSRSGHGRLRPIVVVENDGDEVVSLMSMRIVLLDENGDPLAEVNQWVATPIAADDDEWRGPLLPGETRQFPVNGDHRFRDANENEAVDIAYEITEVRTWRGPTTGATTDAHGTAVKGRSPARTTL